MYSRIILFNIVRFVFYPPHHSISQRMVSRCLHTVPGKTVMLCRPTCGVTFQFSQLLCRGIMKYHFEHCNVKSDAEPLNRKPQTTKIFIISILSYSDVWLFCNNFTLNVSLRAGVCRPCVETELTATIVHFKRLGSRCFYDLFERCYFFFLNRYAYNKTKPLDIWGYFFQNFLRRYS